MMKAMEIMFVVIGGISILRFLFNWVLEAASGDPSGGIIKWLALVVTAISLLGIAVIEISHKLNKPECSDALMTDKV